MMANIVVGRGQPQMMNHAVGSPTDQTCRWWPLTTTFCWW